MGACWVSGPKDPSSVICLLPKCWFSFACTYRTCSCTWRNDDAVRIPQSFRFHRASDSTELQVPQEFRFRRGSDSTASRKGVGGRDERRRKKVTASRRDSTGHGKCNVVHI